MHHVRNQHILTGNKGINGDTQFILSHLLCIFKMYLFLPGVNSIHIIGRSF